MFSSRREPSPCISLLWEWSSSDSAHWLLLLRVQKPGSWLELPHQRISSLGLLFFWLDKLSVLCKSSAKDSSPPSLMPLVVTDMNVVFRTRVALVDCSRSRGSHLSQAIVWRAPSPGPPEPGSYWSRRCWRCRSFLQVLQWGHYRTHQVWKVGGGRFCQRSRGLWLYRWPDKQHKSVFQMSTSAGKTGISWLWVQESV